MSPLTSFPLPILRRKEVGKTSVCASAVVLCDAAVDGIENTLMTAGRVEIFGSFIDTWYASSVAEGQAGIRTPRQKHVERWPCVTWSSPEGAERFRRGF